jgi:hypothetical protein
MVSYRQLESNVEGILLADYAEPRYYNCEAAATSMQHQQRTFGFSHCHQQGASTLLAEIQVFLTFRTHVRLIQWSFNSTSLSPRHLSIGKFQPITFADNTVTINRVPGGKQTNLQTYQQQQQCWRWSSNHLQGLQQQPCWQKAPPTNQEFTSSWRKATRHHCNDQQLSSPTSDGILCLAT